MPLQTEVLIVGRFPPPLDGQTVATERVASLIEDYVDVTRACVTAPGDATAVAPTRFRPDRLKHYLAKRAEVHDTLATRPEALVLWPAISPRALGHWRDILTVVPSFASGQRIYAVIHHGNFDKLFTSGLTAATARRLVERVHRFVFLSDVLANRCAPWIPPAKRCVIPNTIDESLLFTPQEIHAKRAARLARPLSSPTRIVFVSNMVPEKGFGDVLEAVRQLRDRRVPVSACFAGRWHSPTDHAKFERYVDRHRLRTQVTHIGAVESRSRMRATYLNADVFVLPTYYPTEAQPLTILEAMSAGTPIIATAHASIPEMMANGREGVFVPPRQPAAIAEAIESMRDRQTWHAASRAARARFVDDFSPNVVRERWLDLLAITNQPQRRAA